MRERVVTDSDDEDEDMAAAEFNQARLDVAARGNTGTWPGHRHAQPPRHRRVSGSDRHRNMDNNLEQG